jgi:ribosome-binding factor A
MSHPPSPRMRKVNELLREVVAEEITELKDPGIGFITITGVDTAPDLRHAIVFYSVLGTAEEAKATAGALRRAGPRLQAAVAGQTRIKYTPVLEFRVDPAIEHGLQIDRILHDLSTEGEPE